MYVPQEGTYMFLRDSTFLGGLSCNPEGNTLAAIELLRLLETSRSITAKQSNGTREKTQSTYSERNHNRNTTRI